MRENDHNIGFYENRHFLKKNVENDPQYRDHNIDP
jgi:hypothetical protein